MRAYYEDVWRRLPPQLEHPDFELRSAFLRASLRPGIAALDLGCGDGTFTALMADAGVRPVGVDVAQAALERARAAHPQLEFGRVEIGGELPFPDGRFELVWSSEVIEHIADTGPWLSEARRVLAPGGQLLVTTPSHGRLRLLLGGIEAYSEPLGDHLHLYTKRSLSGLLRDFGFGELRVRTAGGLWPWRRLLLASAIR